MTEQAHLLTDYNNRRERVKNRLGTELFVATEDTVELLKLVIETGDIVCLEGNNQKQADFLAACLCQIDPRELNNLHLVQSSLVLDEHIELFRRGIAKKLDFAFSGPQARPLFEAVSDELVEIGAIHTYLELYGRYFVDLTPRVAMVVADACDEQGNLYTGSNTEDTPVITEATNFKNGIVIAQVREKREQLERVDIPADWVDYIVVTNEPYHHQALFTRDPAKITNLQVLMGMMVIKGIYAEYNLQSLNHGLGFATAAIELLLPTYGAQLPLPENCCSQWVLNPHPTLIPAIEAGIVKKVYPFGGEVGTDNYVQARPDIFPTDSNCLMRSGRCNAHIAGLYGIDCFTGATLQIDKYGNSSTAIKGMIAGFGGAPNLGSTPPGRRHMTGSYMQAGKFHHDNYFGRKLVVQVTPTMSEKKQIPVFRDKLDAYELYESGYFDVPPIMIDSDQVTHIVTEQGIAYLDRCCSRGERMAAIQAVAGDTEIGQRERKAETKKLRRQGKVKTADDLSIDPAQISTELLAAHDLTELKEISGGLYQPPDYLL